MDVIEEPANEPLPQWEVEEVIKVPEWITTKKQFRRWKREFKRRRRMMKTTTEVNDISEPGQEVIRLAQVDDISERGKDEIAVPDDYGSGSEEVVISLAEDEVGDISEPEKSNRVRAVEVEVQPEPKITTIEVDPVITPVEVEPVIPAFEPESLSDPHQFVITREAMHQYLACISCPMVFPNEKFKEEIVPTPVEVERQGESTNTQIRFVSPEKSLQRGREGKDEKLLTCAGLARMTSENGPLTHQKIRDLERAHHEPPPPPPVEVEVKVKSETTNFPKRPPVTPTPNKSLEPGRKGKDKKYILQHLTCVICVHEFGSLSKLIDHTNVHTDEAPYFCTKCDATFKQSGHLTEHVNATHVPDSSSSSGGGFTCEVCGSCFRRASCFRKHKLVHERKELFQCLLCTKLFSWKSCLKRHLGRTHKIDMGRDWEARFLRVIAKDKADEEERKLFLQSKPVYPSLTCLFCERGFGATWEFERHMLTHTEETPYFCGGQCDATFRTSSQLKEHSRRAILHPSSGFNCGGCGKSFRHPSYLRKHKRICGSNAQAKPRKELCESLLSSRIRNLDLECVFSKKQFKAAKPFKRHLLMHTGEAPFFCGRCDGTFRSPEGLKLHSRTQHAHPGGNDSFTCGFCGKGFGHRRNLLRHRLRHGEKGYECVYCKKRFHEEARVISHLLSFHRNKKSFPIEK